MWMYLTGLHLTFKLSVTGNMLTLCWKSIVKYVLDGFQNIFSETHFVQFPKNNSSKTLEGKQQKWEQKLKPRFFFTEMGLKYFSQKSCQSIAFLWKDSKISFEKKKVWSGITLPSDLWCRDVRLPGLQNVTDLMDTSVQKYSIKDTVFTNQAIFRMSCSANVEFKLTKDNKNINLKIIFCQF